jgi:hypothetical protein
MKRLAIIIALLPSAGQAETVDGNFLLAQCDGMSRTVRGVGCTSYIAGFRDALDVAQDAAGTPHCIPPTVNVGQVRDVAIRYLKQHPESRHHPAAMLLLRAVEEVWCPVKP